MWFLNPCHCWIPRTTVVSKYRQRTGGASYGADVLYFCTGGGRFESGPRHCVPWLRILLVFFSPSRQVPWYCGYQATAAGLRILFTSLSHNYCGIRRRVVWGVRCRRLKCVATVTQACVLRYHFRAGSQNLRKAAVTVVVAVCPSVCNNSAPTGQIFMKFDIWVFFEYLLRKFRISLKSEKNNGCFARGLVNICGSRWILLRMRNVSDQRFIENRNTHFMFNNFPPPCEDRASNEV